MLHRRDFFLQAAAASGGLVLAPWLQNALGAPSTGKPPMRFIFMHKGNGLFPHALVPTTLNKDDAEREKRKDAFRVSLDKHELPEWMAPIASHKSHLTILQGLSGKMCTTGHHT